MEDWSRVCFVRINSNLQGEAQGEEHVADNPVQQDYNGFVGANLFAHPFPASLSTQVFCCCLFQLWRNKRLCFISAFYI